MWSRIPPNSSIWQNETDPSSGKNAPHLELYFAVCPILTRPLQTHSEYSFRRRAGPGPERQ